MTIVMMTFIPCGAKLPIIAFRRCIFHGAWWVAPGTYLKGMVAVTSFGTRMSEGDPHRSLWNCPDVTWRDLEVYRPCERRAESVRKIGTVILLATIFIWFTSGFGRKKGTSPCSMGCKLDGQLNIASK